MDGVLDEAALLGDVDGHVGGLAGGGGDGLALHRGGGGVGTAGEPALLHPQVGGRGQDDQPQGHEGHGVVHTLPEAAGALFFLEVGLLRRGGEALPGPGSGLTGLDSGEDGGGLFPGHIQLFEGGGHQGLHPGGGGAGDLGGLGGGPSTADAEVEGGLVPAGQAQDGPQGVGEGEGQGEGAALPGGLCFFAGFGVFGVKVVAGAVDGPEEARRAGLGFPPALFYGIEVLQALPQEGEGLALGGRVQVAQGEQVPGVLVVEGFQLGKAGTEGHRGQSFPGVCFLAWRRGCFPRRAARSSATSLVSSHMATSAPKNRMYMQKNSQNMRMIKVARLP